MAVQLHIMQSSGKLSGAVNDRLVRILNETYEACSQKLEFADIDVVVMNAPMNVIARLGIGGFCNDAHQITIWLDVDNSYLNKHFDDCVSSTFVHELHHCARIHALQERLYKTYGSALIAEGLACCFQEEVDGRTPFYATECNGHALLRFSKKAKKRVHLDIRELPKGWRHWIFGSAERPRTFPYQCGYSLGYALVRAWLDANDQTASEAVAVDEAVVLDAWKAGSINPFC